MGTRRTLTLLGLVVAAGLALAPRSAAAADEDVQVEVEIDGQPLSEASSTDPIVLDPGRPATVVVHVTNDGEEPVDVQTIRLDGKVGGLRFFAYETTLGIAVAPGSTEYREFALDLGALDGQAVGLLPAAVKLLDEDRTVVARQSAVVEVRGSLVSVYGIWGLAAAALAGLQLARLGVAVARNSLPANRWRRGARFAALGATVGTVVMFALSTRRVVAPHATLLLPVVGGIAAAMFLLGYVSPFDHGDVDEADDDAGDDDVDDDGVVERALAGPRDPYATNQVAVRLPGAASSPADDLTSRSER